MNGIDALIAGMAPDGGWGYAPGQPPHLEPTCLALLALAANKEAHAAAIQAGLSFLAAQRHTDGSYRLLRGRPQAFWPTALVLFTRRVLGDVQPPLQATIERLIRQQGKPVIDDPEFASLVDIDCELIGWSWAARNFSWVEPTAWAILALRMCGQHAEPRVVEGARLLIDRMFDDGGVNYGNRTTLGRRTHPIPTPTALTLLALQHVEHPRLDESRKYLRDAVTSRADIEHLAWAKLAFHAWGAPADELAEYDDRLRSRYAAQTDGGRVMSLARHALTALALDAEKFNPFKLPSDGTIPLEDASVPEVVPLPDEPEARGLVTKIKSGFRGMLFKGIDAMRQPPAFSGVHIARAHSYVDDLAPLLAQQYTHFKEHVPLAGKRVVLKPNLVEWHRELVVNTDPRFIDAVIRFCRAEGASEVIVAEGPGHWRNVAFLVEESGLGEVLRKLDVPFVDLNHDEPIKMPNLGRTTGLESLYLTRTVVTADVFISLPKLKMHHWAGVTLSLKNLFGTMPGICYGWPKNELHWRGIPQSIVDIAATHTPHLAIVDGIVGMDGDGPINGNAKHMGAILMGHDLVAVDATGARLMGMPPERIPTLGLAAAKKLGRIKEAEIPQLGEPIAALAQAWEWPPRMEESLLPVEKTAASA